MRTTVSLDEDVLAAVRALAEHENKTMGEVLSALARKALTPERAPPKYRNGIALFPVRPGATPVTLEMVNRLRDELP